MENHQTHNDAEIEDAVILPDQRNGRRGDGGIYLVVVDDHEDFSMTLRYAARRAEANRAHIGLIRVISLDDFVHWQNVEAIMMKELREQAEKFLWNVAKEVHALNGLFPALYIAEGDPIEALIRTVNDDTTIRLLMLGGRGSGADHGPLVSYFTGRGLHKLRVPLVLVPGNLDPEKVDSIAL